MTLAERLKEQRKRAGLSQEELAELAGVSRQAVTKWESGRAAPSTKHLFRLAEIFGTTVDLLLPGEPPAPETPGAPPCGQEREAPGPAFRERAKRNLRCALAVAAGYRLRAEPDPEGLASYASAPSRVSRGEGSRTGTHELSCAHVGTSYDDVRALDDVSLAARGLTLVLGRSGSGKTTLGGVLAGVLEPDEGGAALDGRPVRVGDVGLALQRPEDQLFCDTVLDDIAYGPRQRGLGEDAALEAAREAASLLGVGEDLLERSPFELSGGQMRRVALAGVVACGRGALVLDEPTAGLDAESRQELREVARGLVERGAAVVVITHDAGEWLGDATSVALLREGRLVAVADPARAASDPVLYETAGLAAPFSVRLCAALGEVGDA